MKLGGFINVDSSYEIFKALGRYKVPVIFNYYKIEFLLLNKIHKYC